jgi:thiol-disulfide isomerase/thioredoxin
MSSAGLPVEGGLPSFDGATGWLSSPPLAASDLSGKIILVNFWTYTCINWLRQLPYLRAWAEKYADHELIVIGVHTPEFSFEHDLANVRGAVRDMRIDYPIAIDNDYAVWRAFANHYWPACTSPTGRGVSGTTNAVALNTERGQIACWFHARDLHLVMGPARRTGPTSMTRATER